MMIIKKLQIYKFLKILMFQKFTLNVFNVEMTKFHFKSKQYNKLSKKFKKYFRSKQFYHRWCPSTLKQDSTKVDGCLVLDISVQTGSVVSKKRSRYWHFTIDLEMWMMLKPFIISSYSIMILSTNTCKSL